MSTNIDQISWADLSEEQLNQLISRAGDELENIKKRKFEEVKTQIKELSESVGMTPEEMVMEMQRGRRTGRAGSAAKAPKTIAYQNPDNPNETWGGRGKRPNWILEKLEQGIQLQDLRV